MFFVMGAPLLVTVAVLYFGAHMVLADKIKAGDMVAFVFYQQSLSEAIGSIGDVFTGLMSAAGAADKVFALIDRSPAIAPSGTLDPQPPPPGSGGAAGFVVGRGGGGGGGRGFVGSIAFEQVWLVYPSRPDTQVLRGISFGIRPGQVVALVGESGSGKSSCVALLQRWYDPQEGQVLLDGRPIAAYSHAALHRHMALVGQEPVLYARSIRDNISYGCDDYGWSEDELEARVVAAAKQAKAHGFISGLQDGYDSLAGERGGQLSGGQKQRIAIARALVRDPSVLLLDEATSALDTSSEAQVQAAIDASMRGRTVVIIAHRLSTVRRADRIIVMSAGQVIEEGSHDDLIARGGSYSELVAKQMEAHAPSHEKRGGGVGGGVGGGGSSSSSSTRRRGASEDTATGGAGGEEGEGGASPRKDQSPSKFKIRSTETGSAPRDRRKEQAVRSRLFGTPGGVGEDGDGEWGVRASDLSRVETPGAGSPP
jgi:ATP-binding cassette subfamily B (MDR/TAP) protein 9